MCWQPYQIIYWQQQHVKLTFPRSRSHYLLLSSFFLKLKQFLFQFPNHVFSIFSHTPPPSLNMDPHSVSRRTLILSNHLRHNPPPASAILDRSMCLNYSPPELSETNQVTFDVREMRRLLDVHNLEDRDWLYGLIVQSGLFNRREVDGRVFVSPDYNQSMEQQREMTMKRIAYLLDRGVFRGWLTGEGPQDELRKLALHEVIGMYDHSLAVKLGVHFFLWYFSLSLIFISQLLFFIVGFVFIYATRFVSLSLL